MQAYEAKPLLDAKDALGEGPLWSAREQALYWVDVIGNRLRRWEPKSGAFQSWQCPAMPTAVGDKTGHGLIVTLFDGIYDFDPGTGAFGLRHLVEPDRPANRCNDSKVGPDGRYWFGTMQNNIAVDGQAIPITDSSGALYSLDAAGKLLKHLDHVGISNTLAWSPDASHFYFADSLAGTIRRFSFELADSTLGSPLVFPSLDPSFGVPDGSTMDAEGCLWNARWDGGCLLRFSPEGEVLARINLRARRPTCAVFGGPDLKTLYITSASDGLSAAERDLDGALFAVDLPVGGLPASTFGPSHGTGLREGIHNTFDQ